MLNEIVDLPAGVIGFEVTGKLQTEDYRDVLLPALQKAVADGEVRIVIVIPSFEGMSGGALWQDLKMGVGTGVRGSGSPSSPTSDGWPTPPTGSDG